MQDSSTALAPVLQFRQDIHDRLRTKIRQAIEEVLEEELLAALGSDRHERTAGRRGYRHGARPRTVTTTAGTRTLVVPRGRVETPTGTTEFQSAVLRATLAGPGTWMMRCWAAIWPGPIAAAFGRR